MSVADFKLIPMSPSHASSSFRHCSCVGCCHTSKIVPFDWGSMNASFRVDASSREATISDSFRRNGAMAMAESLKCSTPNRICTTVAKHMTPAIICNMATNMPSGSQTIWAHLSLRSSLRRDSERLHGDTLLLNGRRTRMAARTRLRPQGMSTTVVHKRRNPVRYTRAGRNPRPVVIQNTSRIIGHLHAMTVDRHRPTQPQRRAQVSPNPD